MQPHRRMVAETLLHSLRLVRRQIVGDHVNLLAGRLMRHDLAQKRTAGNHVQRRRGMNRIQSP